MSELEELKKENRRLYDLAFLLRCHPEDAEMIALEMLFSDTHDFDNCGHIKPKEKKETRKDRKRARKQA